MEEEYCLSGQYNECPECAARIFESRKKKNGWQKEKDEWVLYKDGKAVTGGNIPILINILNSH